jgi:hypothetical protein
MNITFFLSCSIKLIVGLIVKLKKKALSLYNAIETISVDR